MTQQQLVQEFKSYPKAKKSVVVSELLRILADDLEETSRSVREDLREKEIEKHSSDERQTAYLRLRGIAAVTGKTPPTDEDIKEDYTNYLAEKYK